MLCFRIFNFIGFFMNLYVGNLPNSITESELSSVFNEYGNVQSLKIIIDRETGRSRGFGFIEMADNDGKNAINGLNGTELQGRKLTVNEAQENRQNNRRY